MDERAFAALTRRAASAESRRALLGAVALSLAAPLLGRFGYSYAGAAEVGEEAFGFCRVGGFKCGRNQQCCTGRCRSDSTCSCHKRGRPCINRVGANCCSKKCRNGKCK